MSIFSRPDRILQRLVRTRFLVTTHSGATWDGVLMEVDDRSLVLRDVKVIGRDGAETPADGEVLVPRGDVAYMQRTP